MRRKWMYLACLLAGVAAWSGAGACAQTDIAASIDGAFSGTTTSGLYAQRPSNSAGGLLEVRHILNPLVGFEATYSYHRANQVSTYIGPIHPCPISPTGGVVNCSNPPIVIAANAHTITGDWVVSRKKRSLRYFALAGGGVLFVVPGGGQMYTSTATEFVFEFGIGLDWELASHFGLRLQDRANIYSAPNLNTFSTATGDLTYTEEPALGIYYRF